MMHNIKGLEKSLILLYNTGGGNVDEDFTC